MRRGAWGDGSGWGALEGLLGVGPGHATADGPPCHHRGRGCPRKTHKMRTCTCVHIDVPVRVHASTHAHTLSHVRARAHAHMLICSARVAGIAMACTDPTLQTGLAGPRGQR